MTNKKQNTERQTRKPKNSECEKAVSLRHGLYAGLILYYIKYQIMIHKLIFDVL